MPELGWMTRLELGRMTGLSPSLAAQIEEHWNPWGMVASGSILLLAVYKLRSLYKRRAIRVPHPNKRVADGEPEVIIVGSGILGSSLAAALGKDGRRVTVVERDLNEPQRIVGEFMQPGGVAALTKLGLEDCFKGIDAQPNNGINLRNTDSTKFFTYLPFREDYPRGYSFHHGRVVQQLRKAAMAENTVTYIEGVVLELLEEDGAVVGVNYRRKDAAAAEELRAPLVVVADGIHSKFRKGLTKNQRTPHGTFCGLMMRDVKGYAKDVAEIVLADPSMLIFYQTSDSLTRVLVDFPTFMTVPEDMKTYLKDVIYPILPDSMGGPFLAEVEAGRYKLQPTNCLHAMPVLMPGVIQLGDAINMRHPVTGGGMSSVVCDSIHARDMLRKVPDLYDYSKVMNLYRQLIEDRKQTSFTVNVFSLCFYNVIVSPDYHMRMYRTGLLDYTSKQGNSAIMDIVTAMNRQPSFLIKHLVWIALHSMKLKFKEEGFLRFPVALFHNCLMVIKVYRMAGPYIRGELRTT